MIKMSAVTKVIEKIDVKKLLRTIRGASTSFVTIGLHEDAGKYSDGSHPPEVVEVGFWTEFGTETSPERSWLRSTMDEHAGQINRWREEAIENIVTKGWTLQKGLELVGFRIQVLLQNKIKSNVPPPLAKSTADAKARAGVAPVTLIDTGLMLRSVTYKVILK